MSKYFGSKKDKDTKGIEGSSDNFTDRYDRGYSRHTQWWEEDDYYSDKLDRDAKDLTTHKPYTPSSYTDWTWKGYGGYGYGGGYTSWSYKSYTSTKLTEAMKEEAARAIARVRVFEQGDLPKDVDQEFIDSVKETECATYTGYQKFAYIADVNGAFQNNVAQGIPAESIRPEALTCSSVKRDLHEIAEKGFTRNTMYGFDVHADDSKLPSDAKAAAVSYYKFFSRFKHSPIRQMILEAANWDADTATKLFFENCGGDSAGIEDLNELVQKDKKELESLGMKAGKGPGNLTQINRYLTLKKLVKIIRKSWEFAGERTIQTRKVPYPAEEVDYRTNHSYQEVIKTTMENFANPALMVLKMIQGGLTVRQFEEHIPGPPKQFGVYIDSSGSMHTCMSVPYRDEKTGKKAELTCTRTDWSVAVAICIVQAAHKSSNKVSIYGWDSRICTKLEDATPDKAEEYLWRFPHSGGGTQLDCVIENVNGRKGELEAAIVITDGDVDYSTKWPEHTPLFTVYAFEKDRGFPNPQMNEWSVKWMMADSVMDKSAKDGWHKGGKVAKVEGENK